MRTFGPRTRMPVARYGRSSRLQHALTPFAAWMNGRKRYQGGQRTHIPVVEQDGARLKSVPAGARVTSRRIQALSAKSAGLPPHPLAKFGFSSVGCMPCTRRTLVGEDMRAGRWSGTSKTECGIDTTL